MAVLQNAIGTIVHSENARQLADQWYGVGASADWKVLPHLRATSIVEAKQREEARNRLGIPKNALLICSFGYLGASKLNDRLISAFVHSSLGRNPNAHLVFVGEMGGGEFGQKLTGLIQESGSKSRILITGWANDEKYKDYLKAADIAVQLRSLSRGESSGTILDCMGHGLATIVNANGAMAEVDQSCVLMLNDLFEGQELIEALELLADNSDIRRKIGTRAQELIGAAHSPNHCAASFVEAIEEIYAQDMVETGGLMRKLSMQSLEESEALNLASDS